MIWIAVAILIVFLSIKFPRKTLLIGLGIAGLIILIGTGISIKSSIDNSEKEKIKIQINYAPSSCGEEYPLKVIITNGASKTVNKISWGIEGYLPGYSENALEYSNEESDKILKPGEQFFLCYKVPAIKRHGALQSQLTYKAGWPYVYFQN